MASQPCDVGSPCAVLGAWSSACQTSDPPRKAGSPLGCTHVLDAERSSYDANHPPWPECTRGYPVWGTGTAIFGRLGMDHHRSGGDSRVRGRVRASGGAPQLSGVSAALRMSDAAGLR